MPVARTHKARRRNLRRRVRRPRVGRRKGGRNVMVNRMPRGMQYPFPPRYRTVLTLDNIMDFVPVDLARSGSFQILANCLYGGSIEGSLLNGPYDPSVAGAGAGWTSILNDSNVHAFVNNASYTNVALQTALPLGLPQLMPIPYNRYRVYASKISITIVGFQNDVYNYQLTLACCPVKANAGDPDQARPSYPTPAQVANIAELPRGKMKTMQINTGKGTTLSLFARTSEICGVTKRAVQDNVADFCGYFGTVPGCPSGTSPDIAGTGQVWAWNIAWALPSLVTPLPPTPAPVPTVPRFTLNIKTQYFCEFEQTGTGAFPIVQNTSG